MQPVRIHLQRAFFTATEQPLVQGDGLCAWAFTYPSGVCALRVRNERGELIILPYQGQQIWRATFDGCELTMRTTFDQPMPTTDYLQTYGGFMLHCGATAMGVPGAGDAHPLHGELPNIPYDSAYIDIGEDEGGHYLAVGGTVRYRVGFETDYTAQPCIKLYRDATVAQISMTLCNLRSRPMDYMYLCHINFRPFEGAQLVCSAPADSEHVHVFRDAPANMPPAQRDALLGYMDSIAAQPALHHTVDAATQSYDPEIVMALRYRADAQGDAHCLQVLPQGDACYVSFRPQELPVGLRWIARTGDEDAMGMLLPATGDHKGLTHARVQGLMRSIPAHGSVSIHMSAGYLPRADAQRMQARIADLLR